MHRSSTENYQKLASQLGVFNKSTDGKKVPGSLSENTFLDVTEKSFMKNVEQSPSETSKSEADNFFQNVSTIKRKKTKARTKALIDKTNAELSLVLGNVKDKPAKKCKTTKSKSKKAKKPLVDFSSEEEFASVSTDSVNQRKTLPSRTSKQAANKKLTEASREEEEVFSDSDEKENATQKYVGSKRTGETNSVNLDVPRIHIEKPQGLAKTRKSVFVLADDSFNVEDHRRLSDRGAASHVIPESSEDEDEPAPRVVAQPRANSPNIIPDSDDDLFESDLPSTSSVVPDSQASHVVLETSSESLSTSNSTMQTSGASIISINSSKGSKTKKGSKSKKKKAPIVEFSDSDDNSSVNTSSKSTSNKVKSTKGGKKDTSVEQLSDMLSSVLMSTKKSKSKPKTGKGDGNKPPPDLPLLKRKPRNTDKQKKKQLASFSSSEEDEAVNIPLPKLKKSGKKILNSTRLPTAADASLCPSLDISIIPKCRAPKTDRKMLKKVGKLCPVNCSVTLEKIDVEKYRKSSSGSSSKSLFSPFPPPPTTAGNQSTAADDPATTDISNCKSPEKCSVSLQVSLMPSQEPGDVDSARDPAMTSSPAPGVNSSSTGDVSSSALPPLATAVQNMSIQCSFANSQEAGNTQNSDVIEAGEDNVTEGDDEIHARDDDVINDKKEHTSGVRSPSSTDVSPGLSELSDSGQQNMSIQCSFGNSQEAGNTQNSDVSETTKDDVMDAEVDDVTEAGEEYASDVTIDYSHHEDKDDDSWSEDEDRKTSQRSPQLEVTDAPVSKEISLQASMLSDLDDQSQKSNHATEDADTGEIPGTRSMSLQVSMMQSQQSDEGDSDPLDSPIHDNTTSPLSSPPEETTSHKQNSNGVCSPSDMNNASIQVTLASPTMSEEGFTSTDSPGKVSPDPVHHQKERAAYFSPESNADEFDESSPMPASPIIKLDVQFADVTRSPMLHSDVSFTSPRVASDHVTDDCDVSVQASLPSQESPGRLLSPESRSPAAVSADLSFVSADSSMEKPAGERESFTTWRGESEPRSPARAAAEAALITDDESDSDSDTAFESCEEDLTDSEACGPGEAFPSKEIDKCADSRKDSSDRVKSRRSDSSDESEDDLENFFQKMKAPPKEIEQQEENDLDDTDDFVVSDGSLSEGEDDEFFHVNVNREEDENDLELPEESIYTIGDSSSEEEESEAESKPPVKPKIILDFSSDEDVFKVTPKSKKSIKTTTPRSQRRDRKSDSDDDFVYTPSRNPPNKKLDLDDRTGVQKTPKLPTGSSSDLFKTPKLPPPTLKGLTAIPTKKLHTPLTVPSSCSKVNVRSYSSGHDTSHYSFLASLSTTVTHEHRRDPHALKFVAKFKKHREELCQKLFAIYNNKAFQNQLPEDMPVQWNSRLYKTAGFCAYKKDLSKPNGRSVRIELSEKVCDSAERVRDTLAHEMCHAAVWFVHGKNDGHGPYWKSWAHRVNVAHPDLPLISRCHTYAISTKYVYKCKSCGYQIGRHSKSLDTSKKVCGYCRSPFTCLVNTKHGLKESVSATPKTPRFANFVKENYGRIKSATKGLNHKAVMNKLGEEFASKTKL